MPKLPFSTVDVFTQTRFGGNPLAIVMGADGLSGMTMQAVAAEFNLSETTFVLRSADPQHTARIRVFNRKAEMAFAGHPIIGTAFVLAMENPKLATATLEIEAGIVSVEIQRGNDGLPFGAVVAAPQPLSVGETVSPEVIAKVLGLATDDIIGTTHSPILASVGNPFVISELSEAALPRCNPDLASFREALKAHPQCGSRFSVHVYSRRDRVVLARMFAPLAGTWEDPATGSANAPLAWLLLSLESAIQEASFEIHQGLEMGRPSLLHVIARRTPDGICATLRGSCVPVMNGVIDCA